MPRYGIWCTRHANSVFGFSEAWAKGLDGERMEFDDITLAREKAKAWSGARNVTYEARELH